MDEIWVSWVENAGKCGKMLRQVNGSRRRGKTQLMSRRKETGREWEFFKFLVISSSKFVAPQPTLSHICQHHQVDCLGLSFPPDFSLFFLSFFAHFSPFSTLLPFVSPLKCTPVACKQTHYLAQRGQLG